MDSFFSISSKNVQKIPEYLIYYLFLSLLLNCLSLTLKQQQILILLELNAGCHNRLLSVIRIC